MAKIIKRDEQIRLMQTAADRQDALMKRVLSDALVRDVAKSPAPTQHRSAYERSARTQRYA